MSCAPATAATSMSQEGSGHASVTPRTSRTDPPRATPVPVAFRVGSPLARRWTSKPASATGTPASASGRASASSPAGRSGRRGPAPTRGEQRQEGHRNEREQGGRGRLCGGRRGPVPRAVERQPAEHGPTGDDLARERQPHRQDARPEFAHVAGMASAAWRPDHRHTAQEPAAVHRPGSRCAPTRSRPAVRTIPTNGRTAASFHRLSSTRRPRPGSCRRAGGGSAALGTGR